MDGLFLEFSGRGNQQVATSSPKSSSSLSPFSLRNRDPDIEASPQSAEQEGEPSLVCGGHTTLRDASSCVWSLSTGKLFILI